MAYADDISREVHDYILLMPVHPSGEHHQEDSHRFYFHHHSSLSPFDSVFRGPKRAIIVRVLGEITHFLRPLHGARRKVECSGNGPKRDTLSHVNQQIRSTRQETRKDLHATA
jgi:hypothetical protein